MYSHLRQSKITSLLLLVFFLALPFQTAAGQDVSTTDNPIYIVQSGDTLYGIAMRFGVTTDDIILANGITDPNLVSEGMQLIIPGLEGVGGVLTTTVIPLGQDISSLVRQYQMTQAQLVKLNRITSPSELYAGSSLIIPQSDTQPILSAKGALATGGSLLELAVSSGTNPWTLLLQNDIPESSTVIPGETLYGKKNEDEGPTSAFSALAESIEISPLPLVQGSTAVVRVKTKESLTLGGSLNGMELHFFPVEDGYVALQGVHAMSDVGPAPFILTGVAGNNESFAFQQNVLISSGNYATSYINGVDPATLDEANTAPEDELVHGIITPVSADKLWDGIFSPPVGVPAGYSMVPDCTTDYFGNRRSYNGGPANYFHSGIDLSACENTLNIYAPAAGVVVYTGSLTVRGNYTVIDHGWGVYSAYGHQSEIDVKVGDHVQAGQLIGLIGSTGRVSGPHLHWEIWINGVVVEPIDWVEQAYP
jgi:murein DD-endopeptidase MepM/ murein hydrolase activator NlpD